MSLNRVAREELLRTCRTRGTDALVVFYCRSGAHRSVACARFFAAVAARYASEVQVVHYSESHYWRTRYCGPCAHCLGDVAAKAAVVDAAVNMWFPQPPLSSRGGQRLSQERGGS